MPGSPPAPSTTLGSRELIVLLLAIFAIVLSLSREGAYELEESYLVKFDQGKWANKKHPKEDELLPPPIVTDVDGDGLNELLVITTNHSLQIYDEFVAEPDEPFSKPHLRKEVLLVPALRAGKHGQQPIAMASGYLVPPNQKDSGRSQHVVIVKDGGTILCFDSKFRLQWESHLHGDQDTNDHHTKEVAVILTSTPSRLGDIGTVIVGRRFQKYSETPQTEFFPSWHAPAPSHRPGEGKRRSEDDDDREEADEEDHLPDDPHEHDLFEASHFSYFAFDGATGAMRWKHEAGDFENTPEEQARLEEERADLLPQAEQHILAHTKHLGEQEWTVFRENVLNALPYGWAQRFDTQFGLAHFERGARGAAATKKATIVGAHSRSEHVVAPNVILSYRQMGLEVVHLYTGRMLTQLPLPPQGAYGDIDADGLIERVRTREGVFKKGDCIGVATTYGLQARPIWNVSLCMSGSSTTSGRIESAVPLLLRRDPRGAPGASQKYDAIFFMSTGVVASVAPRGRVKWTSHTSTSWDTNPGMLMFSKIFDSSSLGGMAPDEEEKKLNEKFQHRLHPSVSAMSALPHQHRDLILLQAKHIVLVRASDGAELASARLQSPPLIAPVVGDLNNDGTNDIIVTTSEGYYVYLMHKTVDYEILPLIFSVLLFFAGLTLYLYSSKLNFLFGSSPSTSSVTTPTQRLKVAAD